MVINLLLKAAIGPGLGKVRELSEVTQPGVQTQGASLQLVSPRSVLPLSPLKVAVTGALV